MVLAFLLRLCKHCSHPRACHSPSYPCSLQSPDFWVLVAALRRFIEGEGSGQLPLEGSIPDMHASTQQYLELQRIYRAKADAGDTHLYCTRQRSAPCGRRLSLDCCTVPSSCPC